MRIDRVSRRSIPLTIWYRKYGFHVAIEVRKRQFPLIILWLTSYPTARNDVHVQFLSHMDLVNFNVQKASSSKLLRSTVMHQASSCFTTHSSIGDLRVKDRSSVVSLSLFISNSQRHKTNQTMSVAVLVSRSPFHRYHSQPRGRRRTIVLNLVRPFVARVLCW